MRLPERAAGIAATAGRRWDDAETHFRTALRQAAELSTCPRPPTTVASSPPCCSSATAPGDKAEAEALIDDARDLYRTMGMPKHAAMIEALGRGGA